MVRAKSIIKNMKKPDIFLRKVIHRLPNNIKRRLLRFDSEITITNELIEVAEKYKGKMLFIFPLPNCPWGYMFQRPQQLARALVKQGYPVLYIVDTSYPHDPDWNVRGIKEVEQGLYLYNDGDNSKLLKENLGLFNQVVVWQYWPHQYKYVSQLSQHSHVLRIYDCIDHLTTFDQYDSITADFESSLKEADLVLATSNIIHENIRNYRSDVMLVQNGVCVQDFLSDNLKDWDNISSIKRNYQYVVGYYGAIAEWFDFNLVRNLAKNNTKWAFLIVGEIYQSVDEKVKKLQQECNNVIFLPRIEYSRIPHLLAHFDAAILPFVINHITLSTSPVKVFEYLAGGKPVISTDLPEVRQIDETFVAADYEQFQKKLREELESGDSVTEREKRMNIAKMHSWDEKVVHVLNRIEMIRGKRNAQE